MEEESFLILMVPILRTKTPGKMNLVERNGMYMLSLWTKRVFRGKAAAESPDPELC